MENKKLNLDDEVFEGLADLFVAVGAECRKHGAKLSATIIGRESEATKEAITTKEQNRRADNDRG